MSIVRGPRPETNFLVIDKRITEDKRLSWGAKGMLAFLLGKPDHWRVSVEHLRRQTLGARIKSGRDAVYALLGELKDAGYVEQRPQQHRNGRLGPVEYIVRELPDYPEAVQVPGRQDAVRQDAVDPTLVKIERAASNEESAKNEHSKANARARTFGLSPAEARDLVIQRRVDAKRDQAEADAQWARKNFPPQQSSTGGMA